jgi:hypothetical protein
MVTAGTQSITATDVDSGISGTQTGIVVTPAEAVTFAMQAPSSVAAGTPFVLRLVALDRSGNVVTDYGGTVTFSTSDTDPGVYLPPDYTFQPSDQGAASFALILRTPGDQTVTITGTADPDLTFMVTITVF